MNIDIMNGIMNRNLKVGDRALTKDELIKMSKVDMKELNKNNLVDIKSIKIDNKKSISERAEAYMTQVYNPYVFLCEGKPVKIGFSDNGKSLDMIIKNHFLALKTI